MEIKDEKKKLNNGRILDETVTKGIV